MSITVAIKDGQFEFLPNGQLLDIQDSDKGAQDLAEELLTAYIQDEDYGDDLFSLVGQAAASTEHALAAMSSTRIRDCVARLQAQQQVDPYSSADERIGGIVRLLVDADMTATSFGSILFYLEVNTESGNYTPTLQYQFGLAQAAPPSSVPIITQLGLNPESVVK